MRISFVAVTILFVALASTANSSGYKYYRQSNGYYTCPSIDGANSGILYQRYHDIYGKLRFRRITPPLASEVRSQSSVSYTGREGLERLAQRMAEDSLWLKSFEQIVSKLPDNLGSQLYQRGLNDVYGRYGGAGIPGGVSGFSYRSSSRFGVAGDLGSAQGYPTGYSGGAAYQQFTPDPLTTIKELMSYSVRLAEQAHRYGNQGLSQTQSTIDGTISGLVNAERIRAAGEVAIATVEAAAHQERSTQSSYTYNSETVDSAPSVGTPDAPGRKNWQAVIASRCVQCHSPQEMGGKGQMPLLHGEITDDLKDQIFQQVVLQKMPQDEEGNHSPLTPEEFKSLVTGINQSDGPSDQGI